MAVSISTLIKDTLHLTMVSAGSEVGAMPTGAATGPVGIVSGRDTEDFLLMHFQQLVSLLCTPSQYNCVYLGGTATGTVNIGTSATDAGVINLSAQTPRVWNPQAVSVNGKRLERIEGQAASLYCGDASERGNPAFFLIEGETARILPVPSPGPGVTTASVTVTGGIVPPIPAMNDSLSFLPDETLRYLCPRYGVMMIAARNVDTPELAARGEQADEEFTELVYSMYLNLDAQTRNNTFRVMTVAPRRGMGSLKSRKAMEV